MVVSNRNLLFQRSIFRCYVSFRECNLGDTTFRQSPCVLGWSQVVGFGRSMAPKWCGGSKTCLLGWRGSRLCCIWGRWSWHFFHGIFCPSGGHHDNHHFGVDLSDLHDLRDSTLTSGLYRVLQRVTHTRTTLGLHLELHKARRRAGMQSILQRLSRSDDQCDLLEGPIFSGMVCHQWVSSFHDHNIGHDRWQACRQCDSQCNVGFCAYCHIFLQCGDICTDGLCIVQVHNEWTLQKPHLVEDFSRCYAWSQGLKHLLVCFSGPMDRIWISGKDLWVQPRCRKTKDRKMWVLTLPLWIGQNIGLKIPKFRVQFLKGPRHPPCDWSERGSRWSVSVD